MFGGLSVIGGAPAARRPASLIGWGLVVATLLSAKVDFLKPVFAGFTRRNNQWGHGPYGGIVAGASGGPTYDNTTGASAHFLTSTEPPAAVCGFGTVTPGS